MKLSDGSFFDARYRIEQKIGSGGMADVYKAYDEEKKREVAIKILREESAEDEEFLRRFRAEAMAVKQLSHPGIVQLFEVGESEGMPYLVLEYIDGQTLKQITRTSGALPQKIAAKYAMQICDALHHAHQRNLVHRDIKPQNIMVTSDDQVKVMDFGIARFVDANTMTYANGNVLGSVHYVSPEQARGETVETSSDVYSLGIVLYEMLTGSVPFDNENTVTVVLRQIQEPVPPPSQSNAAVGRALDAIVRKATQKDPRYRYRNLQEMRRDLQRALKEPDGHFVKIKTSSNQESRLQKLFRVRTRTGALIALAISAVLFAFVVMTFVLIIRANVSRNQSEYTFFVPQLVGKTEEDALERCKELSVQMIVRSYVSSETYAPGQVAKQEPISGSYGKTGDVIYVDISTGPSQIETPNFTGQQLEAAQIIMAELGLNVEVHLELSDKPEGTVLHQMPSGGAMLEPGDYVSLWISGDEGNEIKMPTLTDLRLDDALMQLRNVGIDRVIMRYIDDGNSASNIVRTQNPSSGEFLMNHAIVELGVVKSRNMGYYAELAPTVKVMEEGAVVRISTVAIRDGVEIELLWYDHEMPAGVQIVPVTVEAESGGMQVVRIYVEDELVKENRIELHERKKAIEKSEDMENGDDEETASYAETESEKE